MKKNKVLVLSLVLILSIYYASFVNAAIGASGEEDTSPPQQEPISTTAGDLPPTTTTSPTTATGPSITDAQIPSGSTVSVNNGDLTSSAIDTADTKSDVHIKNGLAVTISKNGNVAVSSADSVKIGKITITNPTNLKYNDAAKTVEFDSALKMNEVTRFINFDNLKQSVIQLNNGLLNKLSVKTDTKQSFKSLLPDGTVDITAAKDGSIEADFSKFNGNNDGSAVTYTANKAVLTIKNQKPILSAQQAKPNAPEVVEITKKEDGYITRAENSLITISSDFSDERFVGNETLFNWNINDGVTFALLKSPGTYRYAYKELQQDRNGIFAKADKTFAQSFEISRKENLEKYKLFIDKPTKRSSAGLQENDSNSAYVSLPTHYLKLRGTATYSRINFDYKTTQRFMGGTWWMEVLPADGSYLPIAESFNSQTNTEIQLDSNNIHANISVQPKFLGGKAYNVFFDDLSISESAEGLSRSWTNAPFIIDEFRTKTSDIFFKNILANGWAVTQMQNNTPVVSFYSKQDERQKLFDKEINTYSDAGCEDLNKKMSITQEVINYIRGLLQ